MKEKTIVSHSPQETMDIAGRLVRRLPSGAVLALFGELGSGKTCFVQGLASALGVKQPVTSPTFTLINEYKGRRNLYHIDLYRIRASRDLDSLGLEDYLEPDGITAIEWAERVGNLLPPKAIRIYMAARPDSEERSIRIQSPE
jgi:tRNA threonylcarbamoyladenosine biosynthesis protein TsaE